jgi:cytohesin
MKALIAHKANVNARDRDGETPLHTAATADQPEAIKLLIAHKADPNARDKQGLTPLGLALKEDRREAAALLRQQGAKE